MQLPGGRHGRGHIPAWQRPSAALRYGEKCLGPRRLGGLRVFHHSQAAEQGQGQLLRVPPSSSPQLSTGTHGSTGPVLCPHS